MNNKVLVSNIRKFCSEQNYSIMQLEDDIDVSHGLISRWGKPNGNPPLEKIVEIAKILNKSVDELINENFNIINNVDNKLVTKFENDDIYSNSDIINISDFLIKQEWDVYYISINSIPELTKLISDIKYSNVRSYVTSVEMNKCDYDIEGTIIRKYKIIVDYYLINYYKNHQTTIKLYMKVDDNKPYLLSVSLISLNKLLKEVQNQTAEVLSEFDSLNVLKDNNIVMA